MGQAVEFPSGGVEDEGNVFGKCNAVKKKVKSLVFVN
jgi:hypothetical protein